jgi:hypothetical protein
VKRLFVIFVAVHLLTDLALPSLPGAFRFNPDESVAGVREEPVQAQDREPAPQEGRLWASLPAPGPETKILANSKKGLNTPGPIVLLPRRNPSADQPSEEPTKDD